MPSWFPPYGEWTTLPNSQLSTSGVMETGAAKVVTAWGGAVINTVGIYSGSTWIPGTFLVIWGGGHGDYSGNEYYAYGPLENDSPQWYKPRNPTSPAPTSVDQDGSGNPVSRHTYDTISYVGTNGRNWMLSMGIGARHIDGFDSTTSHKLDFNTASPNSNLPWSTIASTLTGYAQRSAFDPSTDTIWYNAHANNHVGRYLVGTDTHEQALFKSPGWSGTGSSAIDTVRGIWAIQDASVLNFYRLNNGTGNDYYTPTQSGTAPTGMQSILYDSADDAFKFWNNNGKQVWTLRAPASNPYQGGNAWTWSNSTPGAGATPTAAATNGTWSRFAYVSTKGIRGYVLLNSVTESIYFYSADPGTSMGRLSSQRIRPRPFAPGIQR